MAPFPLTPNAPLQAQRAAGAQRTLPAVAWKRLLGAGAFCDKSPFLIRCFDAPRLIAANWIKEFARSNLYKCRNKFFLKYPSSTSLDQHPGFV